MKIAQSILSTIIKALFHPVVLISLFAPIILSVNLVALRDALQFQYGVTEVTGNYPELKSILIDVWAYALIDFNIQLYTLMLAWFIFYIEVFGLAFALIKKYTLTGIGHIINNSTYSLFLALLFVVMFFAGVAIFFSGWLAGPETVKLYLPDGPNISGGIRMPPVESFISWFRLVIIISGMTLAIWEQKVLPNLSCHADK